MFCAKRPDFRKAWWNILTGSASEIGDELCENPLVRKITFTGSTEIGKLLIQKTAGTVKKVSMELGGNAPFIVFDDADLRPGGRGCHGRKIPQLRSDLCLHQPLFRAGRHL